MRIPEWVWRLAALAGVAGLYWGFGAVITLNAIPYLWVAY